MALTTIPVELLTLDDGVTITTADNTTQLQLVSTDTDANAGPLLDLFRSVGSSAADSDQTGSILFSGRNDAPETITYARINSFISDASDGTEDGLLHLKHIVAGTEVAALRLDADEYSFNDSGLNIDFRVEGDSEANLFFVDASTDRVGILTSTPTTALQIVGLNQTNGTLDLTPNAAKGSHASFVHYGTNGDWYIRSASTSGNVNIQDTGGDVVIGGTTPQGGLLTLEGADADMLVLHRTADTGDQSILFKDHGDHNATITGKNGGGLELRTNGNSTVSIAMDSSGNVAIGSDAITTYSNYNTLTIDHDTIGSIIQLNGASSGHYHLLQNNNGQFIISADQGNVTGSSAIIFNVDGSEVAEFGASESVFNDGGADKDFRVEGSGNANLLLVDSGETAVRIGTNSDVLGSSEIFTVNGQVGHKGPASYSYLLSTSTADGSSSIFMSFYVADGATQVGSIDYSGTATRYNTSSDERLKENIKDSEDVGSKLDQIQVRQFDWKATDLHQDYGVVAQELIKVFPEAISQGEEEEAMMSVDYSKLVPMLVKEIQSLRKRVTDLEGE